MQFLEWDSSFFNLNISRVTVADRKITKQDLDFSSNDLIYVFSLIPQEQLEKNGAWVDTKITYAKAVTATVETAHPEIESYAGEPTEDLYNLGILSGWASRFKVDPRLNAQFENMYRLWVSNSTKRLIADEVFVIRKSGKHVGLVTLKQDNTTGSIGIIAVDADYQGKAYGSRLLECADKWYKARGIEEAVVVTQQLNKAACKFYEKHGYSVKATEYIYHVWK
jgi:ribosomal protein S18 acetylase RimI-like enzyme